MMILDTIIAHKREEVKGRKAALPLSILIADQPSIPPRDFRAALTNSAMPAPRVIAELKRRSPSRSMLCPNLDPVQIARIYEQNGAAAISVLTDTQFFGGSLDDLSAVRRAVSIPVLCKDFIVDPYQIYEARAAGADAVLLIASVLTGSQLREFRALAASLGMDSLVEVHNRAELELALKLGADVVGINNRDLRTFEVSLDVTRSLMPMIPPGVVVVSESGIRNRADRELMGNMGVDALLVGESLLTAPDVAAATREICGYRLAPVEARV